MPQYQHNSAAVGGREVWLYPTVELDHPQPPSVTDAELRIMQHMETQMLVALRPERFRLLRECLVPIVSSVFGLAVVCTFLLTPILVAVRIFERDFWLALAIAGAFSSWGNLQCSASSLGQRAHPSRIDSLNIDGKEAVMLDIVKVALRTLGVIDVILVSFVGVRLLQYFDSFFFHWRRYRRLQRVTTADLMCLPSIPFMKVQITTRGSRGSTPVVQRGIERIMDVAAEAPAFYRCFLSVEVVTESCDQKEYLEAFFEEDPIPVSAHVLPRDYKSPNGTQLKARALHYMVELRRRGLNRKPGRTAIVHYDEESVMEPDELRKLIHYLAITDKRLTEGPIYYPLEYRSTALICRAMEANRPMGCFECREVMEVGRPLHMHGSNLVIDEDLENELGWDIGSLDGQPFIAEDYVFGVRAYLLCGPKIFGWHGCVMIEQPPFSYASAFRQRYRWVVGVLQGIDMMKRMPEYHRLPCSMRSALTTGTLFRISAFTRGFPTAVLSSLYTVFMMIYVVMHRTFVPVPLPLVVWFAIVGYLWINSSIIGVWYNLSSATNLTRVQRWNEVMKVLALAPIAGAAESAAAVWATVRWASGHRAVAWTPTPKTSFADQNTVKQLQVARVPDHHVSLTPAGSAVFYRLRAFLTGGLGRTPSPSLSEVRGSEGSGGALTVMLAAAHAKQAKTLARDVVASQGGNLGMAPADHGV